MADSFKVNCKLSFRIPPQDLTSASPTCHQVLHSTFLSDLYDLRHIRALQDSGARQPMDVVQGDVILVAFSHQVNHGLLILVVDHRQVDGACHSPNLLGVEKDIEFSRVSRRNNQGGCVGFFDC